MTNAETNTKISYTAAFLDAADEKRRWRPIQSQQPEFLLESQQRSKLRGHAQWRKPSPAPDLTTACPKQRLRICIRLLRPEQACCRGCGDTDELTARRMHGGAKRQQLTGQMTTDLPNTKLRRLDGLSIS